MGEEQARERCEPPHQPAGRGAVTGVLTEMATRGVAGAQPCPARALGKLDPRAVAKRRVWDQET